MRNERKVSAQLNEIKSVFESNQDLSFKIFDSMPIGICITDKNGKFTDVNETYLSIYGYQRDEMIGGPFTMVVPEESKSELTDLHNQFMGRKYELSGRWKVWGKSKEKFEVITNAAYLSEIDERGPSKMTFVVKANDLEQTIDKLRSAVGLLERKLQAQSDAADLADHQMRNRLGSIVTIANMLEKTELNDMQLRWVKLIKNAGADTIEMLDTTKDFVLMERGEYKPNPTEFDILDMLQQVESELDQLKEIKNSQVSIILNDNSLDYDDEVVVAADKVYLKHLLKNLVSNALEAAPDDSKITVNTQIKSGSDLVITIHNPGMIPPSIQDSFFQKYATSGKEKGTGLGTYVAQMIADVHGGNISFITSEEQGTTLILTLPQ